MPDRVSYWTSVEFEEGCFFFFLRDFFGVVGESDGFGADVDDVGLDEDVELDEGVDDEASEFDDFLLGRPSFGRDAA